jgi:hypothetical protein
LAWAEDLLVLGGADGIRATLGWSAEIDALVVAAEFWWTTLGVEVAARRANSGFILAKFFFTTIVGRATSFRAVVGGEIAVLVWLTRVIVVAADLAFGIFNVTKFTFFAPLIAVTARHAFVALITELFGSTIFRLATPNFAAVACDFTKLVWLTSVVIIAAFHARRQVSVADFSFGAVIWRLTAWHALTLVTELPQLAVTRVTTALLALLRGFFTKLIGFAVGMVAATSFLTDGIRVAAKLIRLTVRVLAAFLAVRRLSNGKITARTVGSDLGHSSVGRRVIEAFWIGSAWVMEMGWKLLKSSRVIFKK